MRHRSLLLLLPLLSCNAGDAPPAGDTPDDTGEGVVTAPFRCDVPDDDAFAPDPRLVRWPYLTSVTPHGAVVQWGLPAGTEGALEWGTSEDFGRVASADLSEVDALVDPVQLHAVTLDGLEPDTPYCYRLTLGDDDLTGPLSFRTAPLPTSKDKVRFLVLGDFGNGSAESAAVRDRIRERYGAFDFWVTTGDNAYSDGTHAEWDAHVFQFYRQILRRVPFFPSAGNHDYRTGTLAPMLENLVLPRMAYDEADHGTYYSFDWGAAHFTVVDSDTRVYQLTTDRDDDDMLDWMRDDLAAAADRPWRIAVWHHPAYLTQPGRSAELGVVFQLLPAAEAGDVDLVLVGHNHIYERFMHIRDGEKVARGTSHITTGGGGASLYPYTPDGGDHHRLPLRDKAAQLHHFVLIEYDDCTLSGQAIDMEGTLFDQWEITRC